MIGKCTPVMAFDEKTAGECLRWWKDRLYLTDWIIKVDIVTPRDLPGRLGENEYDLVHRAAIIRIAEHDSSTEQSIVTICDEATLVHELLYCKYGHDSADGESITSISIHDHMLLEQMARSLVMAKYGLTPDWFDSSKQG